MQPAADGGIHLLDILHRYLRSLHVAEDVYKRQPLNGLPPVDVLIVGRGGGSIEDLWNFNEETVARAIYECTVRCV